MLNARQICSEVYNLSGFGEVTAYKNGDLDDKLIYALLRRVARDIAKYRWQQLIVSGRISIVSNKLSYALPTDFREFIPGSIRTLEDLRMIDFPTSFEMWAQIDSKVGITGVQHRLRIQQDFLQVLPSDTESYTIRFEYISNHPVRQPPTQQQSDEDPTEDEPTIITVPGDTLPTFDDDEDLWLLDEDLIIKALKVKWSIEKGLETLQADASDYTNYLNELKGTQASSQRIKMGSSSPYFPQAPYTNLWK